MPAILYFITNTLTFFAYFFCISAFFAGLFERIFSTLFSTSHFCISAFFCMHFEGRGLIIGKLLIFYISENGYYVATAAGGNEIKIWDLRKLKEVKSIQMNEEDYAVNSLRYILHLLRHYFILI